MSLPKVKAKKFTINLPSNGKDYTFRPFSMGEQKILMMALESGEESEMISALQDVIEECSIDPKIDPKELSSSDLDWVLLKLRERSVGEIMEVMMGHQAHNEKKEPVNNAGTVCFHQQLVRIDTRSAQIVTDAKHNRKIILQEDPLIGVVMKYPTASLMSRLTSSENAKATDFIFEFISLCIESVFTDDEVIDVTQMSSSEVQAFILQFDQDSVMKIFTEFFDTSPKVQLNVKYKCDGCGEHQEVTLEGLRNFF